MSDSERQASHHKGNWYVLVFGLPLPQETVVLAPGMSLIPLPSPMDVFDLAALGAVGFREWSMLEPFVPGCTCEIESPEDSSTLPGFDTLNRAWLALTLLVLRGFTQVKGIAVSSYRWGNVPIPEHAASWNQATDPSQRRARTDLPMFKGSLLDLHIRMMDITGTRQDSITTNDADWIRSNFAAANQLSAESERFQLALRAAVDWRFTTDKRSAIARLWSGIEAIFGISSELVYRLSVTGSCLLEHRGKERIERFREIKKLYGVRSKAVHGEAMTESRLEAGVAQSFELLRDLLILQIERGKVLNQDDFEQAIFC